MLACSSCHHREVFHQADPPEDPCYLCPRGHCLVKGCSCQIYEGVSSSTGSHEEHLRAKTKWGLWGWVQFTVDAGQRLEVAHIVIK